MPIFKTPTALIYFAHVPKCGGTSLERYLQKNLGQPAFLDRSFGKYSPTERWSQSSPQHVDATTLSRLFPTGFFDLCFAVVRHPDDRLRSSFLFQRDIEERIPADMGFSDWLRDLQAHRQQDPFYCDNHPRAMAELVPQDATIFKLEDGLKAVVDWLNTTCPDLDLSGELGEENTLIARLKKAGKPHRPIFLSEADRHLIADLYREDFERFGYTPQPPEPT